MATSQNIQEQQQQQQQQLFQKQQQQQQQQQQQCHRHSIAQAEDIAQIRRARPRCTRADSIAIPVTHDNNNLLDLLVNEQTTALSSSTSTSSSSALSMTLAATDHTPRRRLPLTICPPPPDAERPRPKPKVSAAPPPVPLRVPAVPKRNCIPLAPSNPKHSQIDTNNTSCRNHLSSVQPLLLKSIPTQPPPPPPPPPPSSSSSFQPVFTMKTTSPPYPPPIPPPATRSRPPLSRYQITGPTEKQFNSTVVANTMTAPLKNQSQVQPQSTTYYNVTTKSLPVAFAANATKPSQTEVKQFLSTTVITTTTTTIITTTAAVAITTATTMTTATATTSTSTATTTITSATDFRQKSSPPPPIQKSTSNNKISLRQDSSVSSDSFSQTSSPSYTTKTMETPLLPHHNGPRVLYNVKIGSGTNEKSSGTGVMSSLNAGVNDASSNVDRKKRKSEAEVKDTNCNGALTKSASTPASLQTIVRFHNGSNMSLHHRIIRDMRRPSSHYVSRIRLRFRLAQVVVNAIALLAIGGGLAAYFKAYPSTVQVVQSSNGNDNNNNNNNHNNNHNSNNNNNNNNSNGNTSVTITTTVSTNSALNPAPGICLPIIVHFCQQHKVPYNFTVFPNYMGHFGQRDAQQELEVYDAVVDVRCYELAALFLCSVFVPKCGPAGQVVRPCRSLCVETKRRCDFFLNVFGLALPDYLDCELFPESVDSDGCVGHREVKEAQIRAQKPVCPSGFQCDVKRCIPKDWQCDGHVDCKDQSDELNCVQCAKGMIHCGAEKCMAQEHMCDGEVDCLWAQDERNCLRLSEKNGDEGRGQLEMFRPEHQQWVPACVAHWDQRTSPIDICNLLGYSHSNSSRVIEAATDKTISFPMNDTLAKLRMDPNKRAKKNLLKEFVSCSANSYRTVDLTCTNYVCGKIRKSYAERATMRIVGGIPSKPGDWPFLAALLGGPEEVFYCAGVLIADQWVLTASHCVGNHSDVTGWTIQLGITRRHAHSYYGQKMKVRRVVPHPMYNLGIAHDNDVALFQLASPVTFHEHLLPVCLPPANKELLPGTVCTVIGWGKKEDKDISEYEPEVNEVEVPVLNRDLCNAWLENRDLNVTDGMICAGYKDGGKDACQGDSGGPLLCRDDTDTDRWFVGGIVSWGIKCAHPHLPGVYAYVPKYIPWIKQQMHLYSN